MSDYIDLSSNQEILGQESAPVFINSDEISEKNEKADYSKIYVLPTIKMRYMSTLIDFLIVLLSSFGISTLFEAIGQVPDSVRAITFVVLFLLYEPVLVASGTTIGQLLLNIRVRNFKNPEKKLAFPLVLLRSALKYFLGWISFITVTSDINKRAIHDYASGSIMIANKIEK